jgi:hypothetical protein
MAIESGHWANDTLVQTVEIAEMNWDAWAHRMK